MDHSLVSQNFRLRNSSIFPDKQRVKQCVFLTLFLFSAGSSANGLNELRSQSCKVIPNTSNSCKNLNTNQETIKNTFEALCNVHYPATMQDKCTELKESAFKKIDPELSMESARREHQEIKNRFVNCSMEEACKYESDRSVAASCLSGVKQGAVDLVESLISIPGGIAKALTDDMDKNCFENKNGEKQKLIEMFNSDIPDRFKEYRVPDEVKAAAINNWTCSEIRNYSRTKLRLYQARIGPLVARGEIAPGSEDSPAAQAIKSIIAGLGARWNCYTPEAKAELTCSVVAQTAATLAGGVASKALVKKLAQFGIVEQSLIQSVKSAPTSTGLSRQASSGRNSQSEIEVSSAASSPSSATVPGKPRDVSSGDMANANDSANPASTSNVTSESSSSVKVLPVKSLSKVQQKTWKRFDSENDPEFQQVLSSFRGNDQISFNPQMQGSEGQIFLADHKPDVALKRFFTKAPDPWKGVQYLEDVGKKIDSDPKLSKNLAVVKVHDKGTDWIIREFDPTSKPLKESLSIPEAVEAKAALLRSLVGTKDPMLLRIKNKLERKPISENVHWSFKKKKILLIDVT